METEKLARITLSACGAGAVLHVGCGDGRLLRALLQLGCPAKGFDPDPDQIARAELAIPGRFFSGRPTALPWSADEFDTVICERVLESLDGDELTQSIAELARVTRRSLIVCLRIAPVTAEGPNRAVRDRSWWENRFFAAGLRKHPSYYRVNLYETLELPTLEVLLLLEKLPAPAARAFPPQWLQAERNLHMDMLREAGRRSDGHVIRYQLAADLVRPGDVVLDAACGMGYGSHLIRSTTCASRVIGLDVSDRAVDYARACFASDVQGIEFRTGDAEDLGFLSDHSIDVVVSFETLEHLANPERFLAEARRVLRPGGRVIVSVPNRWVDESGHDPNPHHLHVYDWERLSRELSQEFLVEKAYRQIAGNGFILSNRPRILREVAVDRDPAEESEWWVMVGSVPCAGGERIPYQEIFYTYTQPPENLLAFARDYWNPWLVRSLVEYPTRYLTRRSLNAVASQVLADSPPGSPDEGAGLCVVGYGTLEHDGVPASELDALIERLARYVQREPGNPHERRWRISLGFLQAQLQLKRGRFEEAEASFAACRRFDCLPFSPTLGTKTVLGCFLAGWLARTRGDLEAARSHWKDGITETRRLLQSDWVEFIGDIENPLPFPLVTAVEFLDTAVMCANALRWTASAGRSTSYGDWTALHQCWKTMIDERWRAMQEMEAMIRDRDASLVAQNRRIEDQSRSLSGLEHLVAQKDEAIAAQARLLEERWGTLQQMEHMISERDKSITAQAHLLDERWEMVQNMERMIAQRDEAISSQGEMLVERWNIMQQMEQMIAQRDGTIATQQQLLEARAQTMQQLNGTIGHFAGTDSADERKNAAGGGGTPSSSDMDHLQPSETLLRSVEDRLQERERRLQEQEHRLQEQEQRRLQQEREHQHRLQDQAHQLQLQKQQHEGMAAELQLRLEAAERELERVRRSVLWRAGAPLRWLERHIRISKLDYDPGLSSDRAASGGDLGDSPDVGSPAPTPQNGGAGSKVKE